MDVPGCVDLLPLDIEKVMCFQKENGEHPSGQIIATSHDLTSNGGLVREIPLFQGNPGW